jgi:molecular chaperone DnaJ
MKSQSPFEILGIDPGASPRDVKKAYHRLALKWHPDTNPGNRDAEQRFMEISQAYEILSDPDRRRSYDMGFSFQRAGFPFQGRGGKGRCGRGKGRRCGRGFGFRQA